MRSFEINHFLNSFETIKRVAQRVRDSIYAENSRDSVSRYIQFASINDEPLNFRANAFQGRFIAKFEILKQTVQGRQFMAGQYAFFQVDGDKETRLPFSVKFVEPNCIVFPDGNVLEMPYVTDGDEDEERFAAHQANRVKDAISEALLSHLIENLETWTLDR